jgi:peptidoglycan/LPS O-acetylase OafA/YrhL
LCFLAALFVFIGHATPALVKFNPDVPLLHAISNTLTGVGMSLFFVLSGFVIHYNYADIVAAPALRNTARFYVARFARLYPLFAFLLAADVLLAWKEADLAALPFYAGLAHSWTYVVPDDRSLLNHMDFAQVTWSISTEWFFYCCYPLFAWLPLGGKRYRSVVPVAAVTIAWMAIVAAGYLHPARINNLAGAVWGPTAANVNAGNDYFFAWLFGYSPAGHLEEFLVGVIAALPVHHQVRSTGTGARALACAGALLGALIGLVAMYGAQQSGRLAGPVLQMNALTAFVLPICYATILFCCARYRSLLSRILSSRPLTVAGDASYSLYMFHVIAVTSVAIPVVLPLNGYFATYVAVRYLTILTITIIVSIAMYRFYEVSLRIATRSALNRWLSRRAPRTREGAMIAAAIGIPLSLSIYGWLLAVGFVGLLLLMMLALLLIMTLSVVMSGRIDDRSGPREDVQTPG